MCFSLQNLSSLGVEDLKKIKKECEKTNTSLRKIKVTSGGVMVYCTTSENYMKSLQQLGSYWWTFN